MTMKNTRLGKIEGKTIGNVQVFFGIRFGQAPVGPLRFKQALAAGPLTDENSDEIYDATRPRNCAMQPPLLDFFKAHSRRVNTEPTYDEDCLFLNIYTPAADGNKRPVLFWIHGGSFTTGSGYEYDGRVLTEQGDVVVVTVNYRLGLLGFLDLSEFGDDYLGSASNGIADQILALEWVRDNIADYGGDSGNVTVFGESAGAASVNGLIAAPRADELYHRAIAHSGSAAATPPPSMAATVATHLQIEFAELPTKLASMSAQEIIDIQIASGTGGVLSVDGTVITRGTAEAMGDRGSQGVPYIAGSNANEGTLFTFVMPGDDTTYEQFGAAIATMALDGADPTAYLAALKAQYPEMSVQARYEQVWTDFLRRASINLAEAASAAGPGRLVVSIRPPHQYWWRHIGCHPRKRDRFYLQHLCRR
jgi:para-nitrobenzyl esterase